MKPELKRQLRKAIDQIYEEYVGIHLKPKNLLILWETGENFKEQGVEMKNSNSMPWVAIMLHTHRRGSQSSTERFSDIEVILYRGDEAKIKQH